MAYLASATASSPHVNALFASLSTFLTANGWTLYDTVAAQDLVFRSTGNGRERIFVRFTKSGNNIQFATYQYWEVGVGGYNLGGNGASGYVAADDTSAFNYWFWTDARAIVIAAKVGSVYSGNYAGALKRIHDSNVGFLSGAVSAGLGTVCPVDQASPTIWTPGKKVMVLDQSNVTIGTNEIGNELATVVACGPTSVTLDLAQAHQVGAMIGVDPQPVGMSEGQAGGGVGSGANFWMTNGLGLWQVDTPYGPVFQQANPMDRVGAGATDLIDNHKPDDRSGRHLNQPIYVYKTTASQKEIRGKLSGIFLATPTGIGAEDTTDLALGTYIALPMASTFTRMVWVPTF